MDQALGRLEAAAETQRQAMAGQADTASANATLAGELETLRQERDRLQAKTVARRSSDQASARLAEVLKPVTKSRRV